MRSLWLIACLAACPGPKGTPAPALTASGPKLPALPAIDPAKRGAAYLAVVAEHVQPAWGQFLEDCRLRLPAMHPLNQISLSATAELRVRKDGQVFVRIARGSGNGDFDTAAFDIASDAGPLPRPPAELLSDDDLVHLEWTFARDARQAGPATARVLEVKLPLVQVVEGMLEAKALDRALARVIAAESDREWLAATEKVMVAVVKEGLYSSNGAARRAAVEAVARANLGALVADVHAMAGPIPDLDLRLAAIAASAQLRDPAVASTLASELREDLAARPRLGLAKVEALLTLGKGALALPAIRAELAGGPTVTGLLALARVPDAELATKLGGWMTSGDAATRGAVCEALSGAAPAIAGRWISKGLRDPAAAVRAKCIDAAMGGDKVAARDPAIANRLRELARTDRDVIVRARAIAALGLIEPGHKLRAIGSPSQALRLASVVGASEGELRTLARDADPDVRAAALIALGDRAPELAAVAATDLAAVVRRAAIAITTDDKLLEQLGNDASPEVATAAVVRFASRRGRAAITRQLLASLAATPSGSPARVRVALAWLVAR